MKIHKDNNYGADADGNRGYTVYEAELEPSDYDDVVDALYEHFLDGYSSGNFTIELDGFEFQVDLEDYLDGLFEKSSVDPKVLNDPELLQWIEDEVGIR